MRWPHWFRRGQKADDPAALSGPGSGDPQSGVRRARSTDTVSRRDWATLPPLRPVTSDAPPPSRAHQSFVSNLAGHQAPYRALSNLSHDVRLDAPHGIATGIVAPRPAVVPDAPLPLGATGPPAPEMHPTPTIPTPTRTPSRQSTQLARLPEPRRAPTRPATAAPLPPRRSAPPTPSFGRRIEPAAGAAGTAPKTGPQIVRAPSAGSAMSQTLGKAAPPTPASSPPVAPMAARPAPAEIKARSGAAVAGPPEGPGVTLPVVPLVQRRATLPRADPAPVSGDAALVALVERTKVVPAVERSKPRHEPPVQRAPAARRRQSMLGPPLPEAARQSAPARALSPDLPLTPPVPVSPPVEMNGSESPAVGHAHPRPSVQRAPGKRSTSLPGPSPAVTAGRPSPAETMAPPTGPTKGSAEWTERSTEATERLTEATERHQRSPSRGPLPLVIACPVQAVAETPVPQAPLVVERPLLTSPPRAPAEAPAVQRAPVPVPTDLRSMVEAMTGADLAGVPVHRGPEVSAAATQLSAQAYTASGEVYLPAEHGPLNSGPARGLLAHELTHVAQQRALGSALPPEASLGGVRLESQAARNQEAVSKGGIRPTPTSVNAMSDTGGLPLLRRQAPLRDNGAHPPTPAAAARTAGVATRRSDRSTRFAPAATAAAGSQRAVEVDGPSTPPAVDAPLGTATGRTREESRGGDGGDQIGNEQELDELARRLWPRLHERLRDDLVVARERAGTLVDRF